MLQTKDQNTTVVFGGTLGDAFIVFCKLHSVHQTSGTQFNLIRYDLHPEYDTAIAELFRLSESLHYEIPCTKFQTVAKVLEAIGHCPHPYINGKWEKNEEETLPLDYTSLNPFPDIPLELPTFANSNPRVGIQLSCGLEGHNFRGFSLDWLAKIRRSLPAERFDLYLFGKLAEGSQSAYRHDDIARIAHQHGVITLVNSLSFKQWIGYIKSMDYYISMEGFSAFFALSQKVKVLLFNQQPYRQHLEGSIHPAWRAYSHILNINANPIRRKVRALLGTGHLYSPEVPEAFFIS